MIMELLELEFIFFASTEWLTLLRSVLSFYLSYNIGSSIFHKMTKHYLKTVK